VVVDFALYTAEQAQRAARVLSGRVGHLVAISTGQVYLVRAVVPVPASEGDYEGALMARPTDAYDLDQWTYGVEKREVERVIAQAFPCTTLRLPMVHGGRDFYRRFDSVAYRLLDGGSLFVTRPDAVVRHVYGPAVVRQLHALVDGGRARGAFNLAQPDGTTVRELLERVGGALGVTPRIEVTTEAELRARGLDPLKACPFNQRWMSALDATKASAELGFTHEPMSEWVPAALQAGMARWNEVAPPSMTQRPLELA
jgi:nucleoside-diphosphate-sugar epimerase